MSNNIHGGEVPDYSPELATKLFRNGVMPTEIQEKFGRSMTDIFDDISGFAGEEKMPNIVDDWASNAQMRNIALLQDGSGVPSALKAANDAITKMAEAYGKRFSKLKKEGNGNVIELKLGNLLTGDNSEGLVDIPTVSIVTFSDKPKPAPVKQADIEPTPTPKTTSAPVSTSPISSESKSGNKAYSAIIEENDKAKKMTRAEHMAKMRLARFQPKES